MRRTARKPLWPAANASERWEARFLRIGHGGASAHARANSMASLEAAVALGVDVVEFDVRACRDGLVLLHDEMVPRGGQAVPVAACSMGDVCAGLGHDVLTLGAALDFVRDRALLNLDLKEAGPEQEVLAELHKRRMLPDTLISSLEADSLCRIRRLEPDALTGFSHPKDTGGASGNPRLKPVVDGALVAMRRTLPLRIAGMMARAQANAVMLYYKVISAETVDAVHGLGGKVFVWTVDDAADLRRVQGMGVNGVASNDPRIFAALH